MNRGTLGKLADTLDHARRLMVIGPRGGITTHKL